MKKNQLFAICLLFLCVISFISCSKEEDDSQAVCTSDCTAIMGKILTSGNRPLSGIDIEVNYQKTLGFSNLTRKKAATKSDEKGYFDIRFYIRDDELIKDEWLRMLELNINLKKLDPKQYILPGDMISNSDYTKDPPVITTADVPAITGVYLTFERDTTCGVDCYIPQKRYVNVTLTGFKPQQKYDRFKVITFFPWGFEKDNSQGKLDLDTKYGVCHSALGLFEASKENQTFTNIPFALHEYNIVNIVKTKNGVIMDEYHKVYVSGDSPTSLTYEY